MQKSILRIAVLVCVAALSACGAGIVTGAVLGGGGNGGGAPVKTVTFDRNSGPLVAAAGEEFRTATLRNVAIPANAQLRVVFVWARGPNDFVEAPQDNLLVERPSADETVIRWFMNTAEISQHFIGRETEQDVDVQFVVRAVKDSGTATLVSEAFRLWRRPKLSLIPNEPARGLSTVSVVGGPIELRAENLPTTSARDIIVEFARVGDAPDATRRGTNVVTEPGPDSNVTEIRCIAPPSEFPAQAFVRVAHVLAGRSTVPVQPIYYRPELTGALPRRGGTEGGELVSLTGQGLVPFELGSAPRRLDFRKVQVILHKAGRQSIVPPRDIRPSLSTVNNIVFVVPPSPDGLSGPATIELVLQLPALISVRRDGIFSYGASSPNFEPRGVALLREPVMSTYGRLRGSLLQQGQAVDVAVLSAIGGESFVEVFEGRSNGMFSRRGRPVSAIQRGDPLQLNPVSFAFGEFTGDTYADLYVLHAGDRQTAAKHTILRGVPDELDKLTLSFLRVANTTSHSPDFVAVTDFNRDQRSDLLICWRSAAVSRPQFLIQRGDGGFDFIPLGVPQPLVEACSIDRLDSDGFDDLLFAVGGDNASVSVGFGNGDPGFDTPFGQVSLSSFGLRDMQVVGVHACGVGPDRDVVVVLRHVVNRESRLFVVRHQPGRQFEIPAASIDVVGAVTHTLHADLDDDGIGELVLAFDDGNLQLWKWEPSTRTVFPLQNGGYTGTPGQVQQLSFGVAVSRAGAAPARKAVFVSHTTDLGNVRESRITTLLVGADQSRQPLLIDPEARVDLTGPIRAVAIADLDTGRPGLDVAVYTGTEMARLFNDGIGNMQEDPGASRVSVPPLVASTVCSLPAGSGGSGQTLAFLTEDGFVGLLEPGADQATFSPRSLLDTAVADRVASTSQIGIGDVDGDGTIDLIVMLAAELRAGGARTTIAVLNGHRGAGFPFAMPDSTTQDSLDGQATGLALGNFLPDASGGVRRLEAIVAAPGGRRPGLHTFAFDPGTPRTTDDDRWKILGSIQGTASLAPQLLRATDLDGDGLDDLAVVTRTRNELLVFRNEGDGEDGLELLQTGATVLPLGRAEGIRLADIDGDGLEDLVINVRAQSDGSHDLVVAIMDGVGGFAQQLQIARKRVGSGSMLQFDLGDVNGDSIPDLVLGWSATVDGDSVRMLFGSHR